MQNAYLVIRNEPDLVSEPERLPYQHQFYPAGLHFTVEHKYLGRKTLEARYMDMNDLYGLPTA